MRILAIDTALPAVSACVLSTGAELPLALETLPMVRGHAEALVPLLERVINAVDGGFETIDSVAVTVGPGSFTGIRVGIAAARGIGLTRNIPVLGVSTLAAFAAGFVKSNGQEVVAASVDAKHGQVYIQAFAPDGQTLIKPRAMPIREAIRALGSGPVKLVGSGAPLMAIEAWSMGLRAEVASERISPDITLVARLGLLADPKTSPARPVYLRPINAKPQPMA